MKEKKIHITERVCDDVIKEYSEKYESEIYRQRQLPLYEDGFRTVQRRLFWTFLNRNKTDINSFIKSATIVGDTIKIHPHGDNSIYSTLISEVNGYTNFLIGKGNWGSKYLSNFKAAAMRYTQVKLSEKALEYFRYAALSDLITGETGILEPSFIPVPFPYALINGFFGIIKNGHCIIPPYKPSDLYQRLLYLLGKRDKIIIKPNFDDLEIKGDFEKILTEGKGILKIYPKISINKNVITIKNIFRNIDVSNVLEKLYENEDIKKNIEIKDLSTDEINISIIFKKINNSLFQDFTKTLKDKLTAKLNINIVVFKDHKNYPVISVDQWLLDNFKRLKKIREKEIEMMLEKENFELKFAKILSDIKKVFIKYAKENKINDIENILDKYKSDEEIYRKLQTCTFNKFLKIEKDTKKIEETISLLEKEKRNIDEYILNWLGKIN